MFKSVTFKKFVAQIGSVSLEFFAPAPQNCHSDFFRKLLESLSLLESLHKTFGRGSSYRFLRRMLDCLWLRLRTFKLKAGLLKYGNMRKMY